MTALSTNDAAHLVTGTRQHKHTTPTLHQLHWLPLSQCIRVCVPVTYQPSTTVPRIQLPSSIAHWLSPSDIRTCHSPNKHSFWG